LGRGSAGAKTPVRVTVHFLAKSQRFGLVRQPKSINVGPVQAAARRSSADRVVTFREQYREEMDCQIVHDSIHRREGWSLVYELELGGAPVCFRLGRYRWAVEG
jgi:hypothetical protein